MRHVHLVVTIVLLALVANLAFAAGPLNDRRIFLPQKESDQLVRSTHTKVLPQKKSPVDLNAELATSKVAPMHLTGQPALPPKQLNKNVEAVMSGLPTPIHIGTAQPGGFQTLANLAFLASNGVLGHQVVFILDDASYTENGVVFQNNPTATATNNVVIQPANGGTVITLTDVPANGGGMMFLQSAYLTVEGTPISGSGNLQILLAGIVNPWDAPVVIEDCNTVTISDCIIPGFSAGDAWTNGNGSVTMYADPGMYNTDVTVNGCNLSGGHYGVMEYGNYVTDITAYGVQDRYTTLTNNYIHDVVEVGINIQQVTGAVVRNNIVKRVVLGSGAGASPNLMLATDPLVTPTPPIPNGGSGVLGNYPLIYRVSGICVWGDQAVIDNNLVDSVYNNRTSAGTFGAQAFGIRMICFGNNDPDPAFGGGFSLAGVVSGNMIKTNIVTRIFSKAFQNNGLRWHAVGIDMESGRWDTLVHNTVYLSGTEVGMTHPGSVAPLLINSPATTTAAVNGNDGYPPWTLAGGTNAVSYRVVSIDNILATDRAATTGDNVAMAVEFTSTPAGYVVDYRPPSDYNVLFNGSGGNIFADSKGDHLAGLLDFQTFMAAIPYVVDVHSQADDPTLVSPSDVHINPLGYSTADGTAEPYPGITKDYYSTPLDSPPDIGAVVGAGAGAPHDVKPLSLVSPVASGVPVGIAFGPFQVSVLNMTSNAEAAVPITIHITYPDLSTHDFSGTFNIVASGVATASVNGPWTPPVAGNYSFTIYTNLGTDNYHSNDTIYTTIPAAGQVVVDSTAGYCQDFESGPAGWSGTSTFVLGTPHKTPHTDSNGYTMGGYIEGAHSGTKAWVTGGIDGLTGGSGNTMDELYSPFFDLSQLTSGGFLSFFHFLASEPMFDGSDMEYTVDTGKTWKVLGAANAPAPAVNWYNPSLYQNIVHDAASFDHADANLFGFAGPPTFWTSNGHPGNLDGAWDDVPTGPFGYVYARIPLPADAYGHTFIRFRYRYFSDPGGENDGAAFDDFCIQKTAGTFGGKVTGHKFLDANGDGVFQNGELPMSGVKLVLQYFSVPIETLATDVNGNASFTGLLPGSYTFGAIEPAGYIQSTSNSDNNDGSATHSDTILVGDYQGSISGMKWNDLNKDSLKGANEPGLAGWTIQAEKDSCGGTVVTSAVTDTNGHYTLVLLPGHYWIQEVQQPNWLQTYPPTPCVAESVVGTSGSSSAVVTGVNFGNFEWGVLTIHKYVDKNGNGIDEGGQDHTALPTGVIGVIEIKKNNVHLLYDTLGNNSGTTSHAGLDFGHYTIQEVYATPPWYQTLQTGTVLDITASGQSGTAEFLNFKPYTICGQKFEDLNGNGIKDAGEPPLAGFTITVSGSMLGGNTAVTDANGSWCIDSVGGGTHYITETVPAGWTKTAPVGIDSIVSNYISLWTGTGTGVATAKTIGNFKNICISGTKYRDRNHNGVRDAGEEGLDSVIITVATPTGHVSVLTDASGNYQICNLGPGKDTVSETVPAGYTQTQPPAPGKYIFTASSHTDVPNLVFGNFFINDSTYLYRTFSSDDIEQGAQEKSVKRPKDPTILDSHGHPKNPIGPKNPYVKPNIRNVIDDYFSKAQAGVVQVGLNGPLNAAGKLKAYIYITTASDFCKSLWDKGVTHSATVDSLDVYRGLDFNNVAKALVGKQKSLSPKVQKNDLAEELMVLAFNLGLEAKAKIPAGFGNLIYNDGALEPSECTQYGFPLNGKTVLQIKAIGDNIMTNYEFVPLSCYKRLEEVASNINQAFSCGGFDCEYFVEPKVDSTSWVHQVKLSVLGIYPLTAASYMRANPGMTPSTPPLWQQMQVPKVYALYQNYPNPFNPTTTIQFDLPEAASVTVKIYNILGQEVATLLNHQAFDAGNQSVNFDATKLASGVYLYRLVAERTSDNGTSMGQSFTQVKKMVLLK